MRQFRGCSRVVYTTYTYNNGTVTFGSTVKSFGDVKNISREISGDSEEVWANNKLQDTTYGGTSVNRKFGFTRIDPAVEAEVLGQTSISIGSGDNAKVAYGTAPDGSTRPYIAVGYALHDGDADKPCEIVWAYKGIVNSISKTANTIDRGTGSEGQEVDITFHAPDAAWTKTGKSELDMNMPVDSTTDSALITKWFARVITPDNAVTELTTTA